MPRFTRVLVANRAVIARRIVRSCRELGLETVVAVTPSDPENAWISQADQVALIPDSPGQSGYLNVEALLQVAQQYQAAIHPGYGFLSERADFHRLCTQAGVPLIAPGLHVLERAGDKVACEQFFQSQGIPVIPAVSWPSVQGAELVRACEQLGYPLMIKPARGGGGQGMLRLDQPALLEKTLQQARAYALSHFGDEALLIEKYLAGARHVEVQLLGDSQGQLAHLFERECSLQRRRQKVIEEAPAIFLSGEERERLWALALQAARLIGLDQVATLEFLWHEGQFYFLEINPRIQVEHAVTEAITGEDLVAWQLRIAQGESVSGLSPAGVRGHSMEARVYAEDPQTGWPSSGRIDWLQLPDGQGLRVELGIQAGSQVSPDFDPLLLKLIAWGPNRELSLHRLHRGLQQLELVGTLSTNLPLLCALLEHSDFRNQTHDTETLEGRDWHLPSPAFAAELLPLLQEMPLPAGQPARPRGFWQPAYRR